ncbi:EscU/YscU/HrcU family type III secretion system export apparatus switch protein, partial [Escherichia coli]|uniref:EscU/YscU/HrcU family type III secretion system export apparatus switch protein n=1 Tax=Escherichia coli TaxID=562 RepID=UPI0011AD71CF
MSEKTEKPTPKKLRDLKKKGDVTKSEEVMAAVQSLILFSFFSLYGMSFFVDIVGLVNTTIDSLNRPFLYAIREILGAVLNVTTGVSQIGFIFAVEKIKPSAQKISVKNNLKNIFSVKSIFELLKSVFKL